jgi:hypothetical protein
MISLEDHLAHHNFLDEPSVEVGHIVRNRFPAIGGVARRLEKDLPDSAARRWAEIILNEVLKGVDASEKWLAAHEGTRD